MRLVAARSLGAAGALLLLLSLFQQWFFDRTVVPNEPLNAWEHYAGVDVLLAAGGVLALAGSLPVLGRGPSVVLRGVAGGVVGVAVLAALVTSSPGPGARVALVAVAMVLLSVAAELVTDRQLARLTDPPVRALVSVFPRLGAGAQRSVPPPAIDWWSLLDAAEATLRRMWRLVTWSPVLAVPVLVWAFPLVPLAPGGGTDGSWITALHVATHEGLDFGTDIAFTYGPLGFLTVPRLAYPDLGRLGFAYVALSYYGLAVTTLWAARRSFPLPVAFVLAIVVLECFRIVSPDEQTQFAVVAMSFMWAVGMLRAERLRDSRWWPAVLALAGAVAGVEVLIKLNSGLTIFMVLGATVAIAGPWRPPIAPLAFTGGFVASVTAGWLAAGQPLGALDDYVRTSFEVISGFAGYQYTEEGGREWEYLAAAILVPVVAVLAWQASTGWRLLRRLGLLALTALVVLSTFKQGFVRHDGHSIAFFASMVAVAIALGWRTGPRAPVWFAVGAALIGFLGAAKPLPFEFHRPSGTMDALRGSIYTLRHPETFMAEQREATRAGEDIPDRMLELIGDHTVHFFPTEAAVAWAQPQLNWRPLPVFQGYVAYTEALDELNADLLRSHRAPERILRSTEYSPFEDPDATMEVFCRYVELDAGEKWQVLARVPSRCGAPRLVERVEARTEQALPVPEIAEDELLFFRVVDGWELPWREQLRALLWKPYDHAVLFDEGDTAARLAPGLGDARNLLKVGRAVDYSKEFRMSLPPEQLTFRLATERVFHEQQFVDRALTVEFYAVTVDRPGVARDRDESTS